MIAVTFLAVVCLLGVTSGQGDTKPLDEIVENLIKTTSEECLATLICQLGARVEYGPLTKLSHDFFSTLDAQSSTVTPLVTYSYAFVLGGSTQNTEFCRTKLAVCPLKDEQLQDLAKAAQ